MAEISVPALQTFVTFNDVAIYFSEQDWESLEEWQKELYRNAMKEIHGVLIAMGYTISNPDVLVRIQNLETSHFHDNLEPTKCKSCCNFPSGFPSNNPDLLLRVKQQAHSLLNDQLQIEDQRCIEDQIYINSTVDKEHCSRIPLVSNLEESIHSSRPNENLLGNNLDVGEQLTEKSKENILCWEDIFEKNEKTVPKERDNKFVNNIELVRKNSAGTVQKKSNQKERLYICSVCGKSFGGNSLLVRHMRIHTGEKPYACNHCEKSFNDKSYLLRHLRTHTGEKPYSCSVCLKCFSQNSSVIAHMRIHTGERPFHCTECNKQFSDKSYFVRHMRTHTGEKPYKCTQCDKCFSQTSSLTSHMRIHTGEKPFKCSDCDKTFSQNSSLVIHKRLHRQEEVL